ncbi:hypothetical protein GCM10010489_21710 [Microbacterium saperdae]|uniref:Glycine rich protein n=1 Tax=Microbacterium saperdae TaxID=69368 RepID=A0A543BMZ3_9MICO|nr:hypothetical protein FB560_1837 [Microbacterium saperdae]GGM49946.1 hypothetical protein GCM10010489_21710 [Microbacterium saperdae]
MSTEHDGTEHIEGDAGSQTRRDGVARRTLVKGAAWSVPVVALAIATPLAAASAARETYTFTVSGNGTQSGLCSVVIPAGATDISYRVVGGGGGGLFSGSGAAMVGVMNSPSADTLVNFVAAGGGLSSLVPRNPPSNPLPLRVGLGGDGFGRGGSGPWDPTAPLTDPPFDTFPSAVGGGGGGGSALLVNGVPAVVAGGGGGFGGTANSFVGGSPTSISYGGNAPLTATGAGTSGPSAYFSRSDLGNVRSATSAPGSGGSSSTAGAAGATSYTGSFTQTSTVMGSAGTLASGATGGNGGNGGLKIASGVVVNNYTLLGSGGGGGGGYGGGGGGSIQHVYLANRELVIAAGGGGAGGNYVAASVGAVVISNTAITLAGNSGSSATSWNGVPGTVFLSFTAAAGLDLGACTA